MIQTGYQYVQLTPSYSYDARTGVTVWNRYRGTPTAIEALFRSERASGRRVEYDPGDGNYATLRSSVGAEDTQPADVPLSEIWTLQGNDMEKSIWTHPDITAEIAKITAKLGQSDISNQALFKKNIEDLVRGEYYTTWMDNTQVRTTNADNSTMLSSWKTEFPTLDSDKINLFITALVSGVDTYLTSQFVLKRSLTVTISSTIKPSYEYVDRIFTTNGLIATEQVDTWLREVLPTGYWLKRTPTLEQITSDKKRIEQEWWHADAFDAFVYGSAVI